MSSKDLAISIKGLGKSYRLAHNRARPSTLAEALIERIRKPFQKQETETFWALKNIDLEIERGDVVGIIGRNGAGKSTLLKILSLITEPTHGRIELFGRIGSLLEVGTGFHPELTGRENIYLNGAILGMRRREISKQFDAIVAFADIEQFLDTPVKRYSSGMYVRLAFAVAAHLNPEILVVDEVLAVGDAEFQKKCLGKMQDVARGGRTVLFVSHNMAAVSNLCRNGVVLNAGEMAFHGPTAGAIEHYLNLSAGTGRDALDLARFRPSWAKPFITSARVLGPGGKEQQHLAMGSDITIEMTFTAPVERPIRRPVMGVVINHNTVGCVGGVNMRMTGFTPPGGPFTSATLTCRLRDVPLLQGRYSIELWLGDGSQDIDCLLNYLTFSIEAADVYGSGQTPFQHLGAIYLQPQWEIKVDPLEDSRLARELQAEAAVAASVGRP